MSVRPEQFGGFPLDPRRRMTPNPLAGGNGLVDNGRHIAGVGGVTGPEDSRQYSWETRERLALPINKVLSGIDTYLLQQSDGKDFIIDMYTIPKIETDPIPPEVGIPILREYKQKVERNLRRLPPEWRVAMRDIEAVTTFLEERGKPKEERIDFGRALDVIYGVPLQAIPQQALDQSLATALRLLRDKVGRFDPNNAKEVQAAYREFHNYRAISSTDDIVRGLARYDITLRNQVGAMLGVDLAAAAYSVRLVEKNEPFFGWERILPEGNFLDTNVHPLKLPAWDWSLISYYSRHEGWHFIMGTLLGRAIREKRVDSIAGYKLIPSTSNWTLEAISQTADEIADLRLDDDTRIANALYRSYVRARSNALLYQEYGVDPDEAINFVQYYAPHKTREEIARDLQQGYDSLFWGGYEYIYGASDYEMMKLASPYIVDFRRKRLLPRLVNNSTNRHSIMEDNHWLLQAA